MNVEALSGAVKENLAQLENSQRSGSETPMLAIPSIHLIC